MARYFFTALVLIIMVGGVIVPGGCGIESDHVQGKNFGSYGIYPVDIISEEMDTPGNNPFGNPDFFPGETEFNHSPFTTEFHGDFAAVGFILIFSLTTILLISLFYNNRLKMAENRVMKLIEERNIFIKGFNHRIKNNLAIINSMVSMQILNSDEEETKQKLTEISNRIISISVVHDNLMQSKSVSKANVYDIFVNLGEKLIQIYCTGTYIGFNVSGEECLIDFDQAISLSMVMNEIISNSLKFAFEGRTFGEISVEYTCSEDKFEMTVSDDGIGIPEHVMSKSQESIGLELIRSLVSLQLKGNAELKIESGTKWLINFPLKPD